MNYDIIIIGAGPVGLCLARALADMALDVALIERQPETSIAEPAFDGREIALTHASMRLLRDIGVWQHIPEEEKSPLRVAQILNGASMPGLLIDSHLTDHAQLGSLVPNHWIRKAAWAALQEITGVDLYMGSTAERVDIQPNRAEVRLSDGSVLHAPLLIAADSRFSETRRALGIDAAIHDFGKSMLVCRMRHEVDHEQIAWEWFDYGQTLALLPLQPNLSSTVITVTGIDAERLMNLPEDEFSEAIEQRYAHRLGKMQLESTRHIYPLVGVYARHFVSRRFALVGDAAVGMHPVTAHGFNFGLGSIERICDSIDIACRQGRDLADPALLARYQKRHRQGTLPLYMTTRAIVELYTNDRPPARWLRDTTLRISHRLRPFQRAIAATLVDDGPIDTPLWQQLKNGLSRFNPMISDDSRNRG